MADVDMEAPAAGATRVFGVDLGSQRCVVAASTGDVVLNELGGMTTATLVSFKGDERLVGEAAVLSSSTNPQNTVDSVNLWLGSDVAAIQQRSGRLPGARATFAAASDAPAHAYGAGAVAVVEYLKGTQEFSTEQLLGMLLGKLTQQMRKKLRDDEAAHVNIAVPSGWGDAAHKALRVAARIAGIPSVSVVTRGAALARCFTRKHPVPTDGDAKHIVIMDMGHSTTSIAAVKLTPDGETVLAEASDLALGSENFDLRLYEHFKQQVLDKHALSVNHAGKEGKRLLQSCERLKKLLSTIGEASVSVENIVPDRDYTLQLTRDVFESLCAPDAQRVHELLTQVLADAQLTSDQVTSVEIVGGGTRIPFVQQAILRAFPGRDASLIGRMLDSTTSVAVGAAFSAPLANSEELSALFMDEEARLIDALVAQEAEMQDRDTDLAAIAHERNAIEAFVYEMRSKAETKHSDKISFAALNPLLDAAEDWIYSEESELATLELIRNKHKQIRQEIQSVCSDYFRAIDADERALEAQLEDESRRAEAEREADGGGDDHDTRKLKKPERMRLVAKNKDEGNELFRDGNFQHAAMRYVKALSHAAKFFDLTATDQVEVDKLKLSLYLNLAQCYLKLEQWPKAIANCRDALALDAKNPKALYRRALAFEKEKKLDEAMQDVKAALAVAPEDKAILKLDERLKVLRKREVDKEKKMWSKAFQ